MTENKDPRIVKIETLIAERNYGAAWYWADEFFGKMPYPQFLQRFCGPNAPMR